MDPAIESLVKLGLKEYEAKVYVALVGLGEANVRRIHEVSMVPRPRVYDVLNALAEKGFINIRQGSPLMYAAVHPKTVISFLKKDLDTAAEKSLKTLESLSVNDQQAYSPIWYVHSDWTIERNLELLGERITRELIIVCFDIETLKKFQGPVASVARNHPVKILLPKGFAGTLPVIARALFYEADTLRNNFEVNVFEKIFLTPIRQEGAVFTLECIFIADDRESMFIYTRDQNRMAILITLPFITSGHYQLFGQMINRAHLIRLDKKGRSARK
ncbi:MAG: TrmB family transcriptional regulator [Methanomicrobiales archaeon]|nr:TrmB family transcriptional regulator [Methanomicrobiales archaeon]